MFFNLLNNKNIIFLLALIGEKEVDLGHQTQILSYHPLNNTKSV